MVGEIRYRVCPVCGNPMRLVNGKWICMVCGYAVNDTPAKVAVAVARRA